MSFGGSKNLPMKKCEQAHAKIQSAQWVLHKWGGVPGDNNTIKRLLRGRAVLRKAKWLFMKEVELLYGILDRPSASPSDGSVCPLSLAVSVLL